MKPLVCIFAHPDDESFGPGGSLAVFAKERDVYVICVTNGDIGVEENPELPAQRRKELENAASILGVKDVEFFDYHDGSLCNKMYHELAKKITERVDYYQPDTLLTFDIKGISGHVDHVIVSLVTTFVFRKLDYVKTLLYWCEHEEILAEIRDEYFIYIPPGCTKKAADIVIDTSAVWAQKNKAMRCHESQKDDCEWFIRVAEKYAKEEYFMKLEK